MGSRPDDRRPAPDRAGAVSVTTDPENAEGLDPSLPQRIIDAHALEATRRLDVVSLVTHPGERGRAREEILHRYLLEVLPEGFQVATGFIIDRLGGQSRKQDLIILRRDYHPRFQLGGAQFFVRDHFREMARADDGQTS